MTFSRISLPTCTAFTIFLLIGSVHSQEIGDHLIDAPGASRFWTTENKISVSMFAAQMAGDAITTQYGLNHGFREMNPLLRPLVTRGVAGQTAASALSFGFGLGIVYWLHAKHHYRAERLTMRMILAGEGAVVGHNIAVIR